MFWDKKEEKSNLPALPPLKPEFANIPHFPEANIDESESHALPAFPEPMGNGFSQAAIKDAVSTEEIVREPEPENQNTLEIEEWTPKSLPPIQEQFTMPLPKKHDVFVKIDKYQSAKRSLIEAKEKLEEIDSLFRKIRETKMREEQELSSWEKELAAIKSRIQTVSENIFEK